MPTAHVRGIDLVYDDHGDGPAVLLVHGHPFDRTLWAPQVATFEDRYRLLVPDLRGYGESPAPEAGLLSSE